MGALSAALEALAESGHLGAESGVAEELRFEETECDEAIMFVLDGANRPTRPPHSL